MTARESGAQIWHAEVPGALQRLVGDSPGGCNYVVCIVERGTLRTHFLAECVAAVSLSRCLRNANHSDPIELTHSPYALQSLPCLPHGSRCLERGEDSFNSTIITALQVIIYPYRWVYHGAYMSHTITSLKLPLKYKVSLF